MLFSPFFFLKANLGDFKIWVSRSNVVKPGQPKNQEWKKSNRRHILFSSNEGVSYSEIQNIIF